MQNRGDSAVTDDRVVDDGLPRSCRFCTTRTGLCRTLNRSQLRHMTETAVRRRMESGCELTSVNAGEHFALIHSGIVRLSKLLRDGRQQIVALRSNPDMIGQPYFYEAELSFRAVTDVEICLVPRMVMENLIEENRALERFLYCRALEEINEARDLLLALGRKSSRERVATFILHIAGLAKAYPLHSGELELPLSRSEIADFLGLTLETVSRQFSAFKREGILEITNARRLVVLDAKRLHMAAST
ncbi:Crp/Fnr family transcriptional regulator [Aureimonas fodinaquatilis]|nr:helix-turn-helix domain-containing protein [Aureimonas fodinaquatilis]